MIQFYCHYEKWEDWQNGMYATGKLPSIEIGRAEMLLTNPVRFQRACEAVLEKWPIATKLNLTNTDCNRNAWLGQAACCFEYGVPESLTRLAWGKLSNAQRLEANRIASLVIRNWEKKYNESQETQLELFSL